MDDERYSGRPGCKNGAEATVGINGCLPLSLLRLPQLKPLTLCLPLLLLPLEPLLLLLLIRLLPTTFRRFGSTRDLLSLTTTLFDFLMKFFVPLLTLFGFQPVQTLLGPRPNHFRVAETSFVDDSPKWRLEEHQRGPDTLGERGERF